MVKFLRIALGIVAGFVLILFAIGNRQPVELSFWPLPPVIELPLYGILLFFAVFGALIGGAAVWLSALPRRIDARKTRKRLREVERQDAELRRIEAERQIAERRTRLGAAPATGQTLVLPGGAR